MPDLLRLTTAAEEAARQAVAFDWRLIGLGMLLALVVAFYSNSGRPR